MDAPWRSHVCGSGKGNIAVFFIFCWRNRVVLKVERRRPIGPDRWASPGASRPNGTCWTDAPALSLEEGKQEIGTASSDWSSLEVRLIQHVPYLYSLFSYTPLRAGSTCTRAMLLAVINDQIRPPTKIKRGEIDNLKHICIYY